MMAVYYVLEVVSAECISWVPGYFSKAPDLYVKVKIDREESKTQTVKRSIRPEWNETFTFKIAYTCPDPDLSVKLKDASGMLPRKDCVGVATVKLKDLFRDNEEAKLELRGPSGSPSSSRVTAIIILRLSIVDAKRGAEAELEATVKSVVKFRPVEQVINKLIHGAVPAANVADERGGSSQPLADLLDKIEVFKRVIDAVATIHPYITTTWRVISALYELAREQIELEDRIVGLVHLMASIFDFVTQIDSLLDKIDYLQARIIDFLTQTTECCLFIRQYSKTRITKRMLTLVDINSKVKEFEERFNDLRRSLAEGTNLHTAFISARISEEVDVIYLKQVLSPADMEASTRPECLPGTRTECLIRIMDWAFSDTDQNMLWLRGVAGSGKSTISKTVSEICATMGRRGAYLFFTRGKSDPGSVIRTIAYRLAGFDKIIATRILESIGSIDDVISASLERQFQKLLFEPLMVAAGSLQGPIAIVLDALDECGTTETRGSLMRLIREAFPKLPSAFRFIITSRPEPDFTRNLVAHPSVYQIELDYSSRSSYDDVRWYIEHELRAIIEDLDVTLPENRPLSVAIDLLSAAAHGLFVWASTAIKYIRSRRDNPVEALEELLAYCESPASHATSETEISDLYDTVLGNSGISWDDPRSRERFVHVLGLIVLSKEPFSVNCIDAFMEFPSRYSSRHIFALLQSVIVYTPGQHDTPIRVFHTSFSDYLLAPERRGQPWYIDVPSERLFFAERCIHVMLSELRFNICDLESSFVHNDLVPNINEAIEWNITQDLEYACRFWAEHLCDVPPSSHLGLLPQMLEDFATSHLLYWFEVLSLTKHFKRLAGRALLEASMWAATSHRKLSHFLWDAYWLASVFSQPISESVPHIYLSALSLAKDISRVAEHYSEFHPTINVHRYGLIPPAPCLKVFKLPVGGMYSVEFSPDGKSIVSANDDGTIYVWDAESGEIICQPSISHQGAVLSVSFSPDGTYFASGSYDQSVSIWEAETGELLRSCIGGHDGAVFSVAFSPRGTRLVSGSSDMTVKVWEVKTGVLACAPLIGHAGVVCSVAYSPDGMRIASGSVDETVRIWDAENGELIAGPFEGHTQIVHSVVFSPDGRYVASGSGDKTVHVWDSETGELVSGPFLGHTAPVFSVDFSPNGKYIVSGSGDQTIRVWDVGSGRLVFGPFEGHTGAVLSVVYSPDGKRVASGSIDDTIRTWDAESREFVDIPEQGHTDFIYSVAVSPDGKLIASGSGDKTIRIWDSKTGMLVNGPFKGHCGTVLSLAFSPDGRTIVSGSIDETVLIWDVQSGDIISGPPDGKFGILFAGNYLPGGRKGFGGLPDKTIRVWVNENSEVVFSPLETHSGAVFSVAVSPDGELIASGSADNTIRIWDAENGKHVNGPLEGHDDWVVSVAFSPYGDRIVSGSRDKTIRIWDTESCLQIFAAKGHSGMVCSVAFAPDGIMIVSGSYDETVRIWDARCGKQVGSPLRGHYGSVYSVDVSRNGEWIVSSGEDGGVCVWDSRTGRLVCDPFKGHTGCVGSVKFLPDGKRIVSGSRDKTIRIWSVDNNADNFSESSSSVVAESDNQSDEDSLLFGHPTGRGNGVLDKSFPSWDISDAGWIYGKGRELLLWVPKDMIPTLWQPSNTALFNCRYSTRLGITDSMVGTRWSDWCRPGRRPAKVAESPYSIITSYIT